ncbi:hypothetical protein MIND_00076700 [Mycena indigotica]|uniref:Uncharacterized protein n=1 Tax=Mycena indigotica TaxID=2126181 RepID=A0A8H6TBR5_9AGAR|nr:uncharacterized protein MIND_00076700 [Mycena indigotica]KAF7315613.1 hypothetical protein MIND_00076700 [Mycena indigotica]
MSDTPPAAHGHVRHGSPVVAFLIGLSIVLTASIANAGGLTLTKLAHLRSKGIPKAQRSRFQPLSILGMGLYILSQVLGSTLALEYMRAEYVAPLGSSSLIFNFLFARFLIGTQVTSADIYGTIVVVLGVIGIVAFGSINSGLGTETDVDHLTRLWRRGPWLGYFFMMSLALIVLLIATYKLDALLAARSELDADPRPSKRHQISRGRNVVVRAWQTVLGLWELGMGMLSEWLEWWTGPKDDTTIAWTLGIGWSCCGGGLAGGCLVFSKATVQLISGSLSHENSGNQLGHAAPIFTILLLAATAVTQIICLNRGLQIYDSTLVVPVFYGVYTAAGWLNSLIFNDNVDSYQSWTLFLIFLSIFVLISGVVLLTHKKPEPGPLSAHSSVPLGSSGLPRMRQRKKAGLAPDLASAEQGDVVVGNEQEVLWGIGDASDDEDDEGQDEDIDHHQHPLSATPTPTTKSRGNGEEGHGLLSRDDEDHDFPPTHDNLQMQRR